MAFRCDYLTAPPNLANNPTPDLPGKRHRKLEILDRLERPELDIIMYSHFVKKSLFNDIAILVAKLCQGTAINIRLLVAEFLQLSRTEYSEYSSEAHNSYVRFEQDFQADGKHKDEALKLEAEINRLKSEPLVLVPTAPMIPRCPTRNYAPAGTCGPARVAVMYN
ncbi:MAG: hypothetical protein Q9218_002570 [Villophora microphyllina]